MPQNAPNTQPALGVEFNKQAKKLSLEANDDTLDRSNDGTAVRAKFITPLDPVVETADGNRLPAIPVDEAHKLNILKDRAEGTHKSSKALAPGGLSRLDRVNDSASKTSEAISESTDTQLGLSIPPSRTHPLFPPLPLYGPATTARDLQCIVFRITSAVLSTAFLAVIVLGSVFTSIPTILGYAWMWMTWRHPDTRRPFQEEELNRKAERSEQERKWIQRQRRRSSTPGNPASVNEYHPLEGGPDRLICDIRYYARRVGLNAEQFKVQTEDGFIIELWHIYNPAENEPARDEQRRPPGPDVFTSGVRDSQTTVCEHLDKGRRYPVLLVHGLLQSAGAYCCNDDDSLAFFLCKSGYDVWLGNNRCGFNPEHSLLKANDPRMWAWNIRQMGVLDLPAFVSRVLEETGFVKLGLVAHSQGTTETFVVLAKEQRPELGDKISVICALAPAVYAGPLIGKMYFKFMHAISPAMFRVFFGVHSFIPLMMTMHRVLPGKLYGFMGYRVFSFLFNWTDTRWDRGLRDRFFQFSPVYVSAESMRWWLGRECFAKHKCVLTTKEEGRREDVEDEEEEERREVEDSQRSDRGRSAWYDEHVPPMALWIAGNDELVDGRRLLRRFERGREPHARIVHSKVIEAYEHLDVLWAMDAIEQVSHEVRQVLFDTMPVDVKRVCRPIEGVKTGKVVEES